VPELPLTVVIIVGVLELLTATVILVRLPKVRLATVILVGLPELLPAAIIIDGLLSEWATTMLNEPVVLLACHVAGKSYRREKYAGASLLVQAMLFRPCMS
jgi:hypothetical protein